MIGPISLLKIALSRLFFCKISASVIELESSELDDISGKVVERLELSGRYCVEGTPRLSCDVLLDLLDVEPRGLPLFLGDVEFTCWLSPTILSIRFCLGGLPLLFGVMISVEERDACSVGPIEISVGPDTEDVSGNSDLVFPANSSHESSGVRGATHGF